MITLHLWRAEWLKTRQRLLNRAMLGLMLAIVVAAFVAAIGIGSFFPHRDRDFDELAELLYPHSDLGRLTKILPFPIGLGVAVELLGNLGRLLFVLFIANSVGSEYGRDTWKMILPRYGSRLAFLMTKWVAGLVWLLLLAAETIVTAVALGWLGALVLGISADPSFQSETAVHLRNLGVTVLELTFVGTLTLFGAVITRSTLGAAIAGIVVPVLMGLVGPFLRLLVTGAPIISPTVHLDYLEVRWVGFNAEEAAQFTLLFNRTVPPLTSALVVLGYIALLLGGSLNLFNRRDMAGE
jgi:ABC-2 type transport system permease protein